MQVDNLITSTGSTLEAPGLIWIGAPKLITKYVLLNMLELINIGAIDYSIDEYNTLADIISIKGIDFCVNSIIEQINITRKIKI